MNTDPFVDVGVPDTYVHIWRMIEICHSFIYFADERISRYRELGLKGGWMGYFATRSAALGAVAPEVVTACFYNFKHSMVARSLPDAWIYTTPEKAYEARLEVADSALRRMLGDDVASAEMVEVSETLVDMALHTSLAGRVLAAAHRALPLPDDPHLRMFWAATVLREYRGDAHNIALADTGIDGCSAHLIMQSLGLVPDEQREYRGWTDEEWQASADALFARGWLDEGGTATNEGRRARTDVEGRTESLCRDVLDHLSESKLLRTEQLMDALATRVNAGGGLSYPNAIGTPPISPATPK